MTALAAPCIDISAGIRLVAGVHTSQGCPFGARRRCLTVGCWGHDTHDGGELDYAPHERVGSSCGRGGALTLGIAGHEQRNLLRCRVRRVALSSVAPPPAAGHHWSACSRWASGSLEAQLTACGCEPVFANPSTAVRSAPFDRQGDRARLFRRGWMAQYRRHSFRVLTLGGSVARSSRMTRSALLRRPDSSHSVTGSTRGGSTGALLPGHALWWSPLHSRSQTVTFVFPGGGSPRSKRRSGS